MKFKNLLKNSKKRNFSEMNYASSGINPGDIVDYQGTRATVNAVSTGGDIKIKLPAGKEITVHSSFLRKIKETETSKTGKKNFYQRFRR